MKIKRWGVINLKLTHTYDDLVFYVINVRVITSGESFAGLGYK